MSSLYVDRKNVSLKSEGEALIFSENGRRVGTVPLGQVSRVIIRGDVQISASLLGKLGEHGIGVIALSGRKGVPSLFMPRVHHDASQRISQFKALLDSSFCLQQARFVVMAKLDGQRRLLMAQRETHPSNRLPLTHCLRQIENCILRLNNTTTINSLRGVEGAAAAAYFEGLAVILPTSLDFHGRNRQPPRDPVNALLSLSYTLLHAETVLALYEVGLDPYIGFYHSLTFGRESLACDVMESLRPAVDQFVLGLFSASLLQADHFSNAESGCFLGKEGRSKFYAAYDAAAETILRPQLQQQVARLVAELCSFALPEAA